MDMNGVAISYEGYTAVVAVDRDGCLEGGVVFDGVVARFVDDDGFKVVKVGVDTLVGLEIGKFFTAHGDELKPSVGLV